MVDYFGGENEGIDWFGYGLINDFNLDIYIFCICVLGFLLFFICNIYFVYKKNNWFLIFKL